MSEINENISYTVTRYMLKSINTKTKSKYIRVSRFVSSRDRSHEQISSLESWHSKIDKKEDSSNAEFSMSKITSQKRSVIDSRAQIQVKKSKRSKKIMLKNDESNDCCESAMCISYVWWVKWLNWMLEYIKLIWLCVRSSIIASLVSTLSLIGK